MQHVGQVYIPLLNYALMVLCVIVVATFQTSVKLGRAYGALPCKILMLSHFSTCRLPTADLLLETREALPDNHNACRIVNTQHVHGNARLAMPEYLGMLQI